MKTSCSFFNNKFDIPANVSMVPKVIGLTTRVPKIPVSAISILFVPSNAVLTKKNLAGQREKKLLALLMSLSWREVPYRVPFLAKFSPFSQATYITTNRVDSCMKKELSRLIRYSVYDHVFSALLTSMHLGILG